MEFHFMKQKWFKWVLTFDLLRTFVLVFKKVIT